MESMIDNIQRTVASLQKHRVEEDNARRRNEVVDLTGDDSD